MKNNDYIAKNDVIYEFGSSKKK